MSAIFPELGGTPSDQTPAALAEGDSGIGTLFVSMARRHPEGLDAQYLRWHSLDHRPEQHRLAGLRASLRVVSTPACRAARAVSAPAYDAIDHVMTYFFADSGGLDGFNSLSKALVNAGRTPFVLPPVQRGVYAVESRSASPAAKAGADVLPWRPVRGVYLLIEQSSLPIAEVRQSADDLLAVAGVAGLWTAKSVATALSSVAAGQQLTICFLDDDPVDTAERLRPVVEQRWQNAAIQPLLAAPFQAIVPFEWDRYLP